MARKKNGKSGGKGGDDGKGRRRARKPNYSLPPDDHLVVKPIRRTKKQADQAEVARLLSHCWDLFGSKDRKAALMAAYSFGADFAETAHEDGEDGEDDEALGDESDYRRVAVHFAFTQAKVINDVERELWSSNVGDPRYVAFQMGFDDWRADLVA